MTNCKAVWGTLFIISGGIVIKKAITTDLISLFVWTTQHNTEPLPAESMFLVKLLPRVSPLVLKCCSSTKDNTAERYRRDFSHGASVFAHSHKKLFVKRAL